MTDPDLMPYLDLEDITQEWLKTTEVGTLVGGKIFQAMPAGSENLKNVVVLSRVGGSPSGTRGLIPEDHGRISFAVWGENRKKAKTIAKALVRQIELLGVLGGYENDEGFLAAGSTINWIWLPDGNFARYVIDAEMVAVGDPAE